MVSLTTGAHNDQKVIYKIDATGAVLDTFTGLSQPFKICIDGSQSLYVTMVNRKPVVKLSLDGTLLDSFPATVNYLSSSPRVAADSSGNIYANGDSNIVKFSNSGVFIKTFGNVRYTSMRNITIGAQGNIFVCESQRVQVFDTDGNFILRFQLRDTIIIDPIDIAVAGNGDVFITDDGGQYAGGQYRVLKYSPR